MLLLGEPSWWERKLLNVVEWIPAEYKNGIKLWYSPFRANLLICNSAENKTLHVQDLDDKDEVMCAVAKPFVTDIKGIYLIKMYTRQKMILFHPKKM